MNISASTDLNNNNHEQKILAKLNLCHLQQGSNIHKLSVQSAYRVYLVWAMTLSMSMDLNNKNHEQKICAELDWCRLQQGSSIHELSIQSAHQVYFGMRYEHSNLNRLEQ